MCRVIHGKGILDGVSSLAEAAMMLRELAGELDRLNDAGWTLNETVSGDYMFVHPPAA